jgi:hypothetical protein
MALVSLGMPVFNATEEDDLDLFINLYRGYLASVGVNYQDRAANPSGVKRAMGILRSCMQGPASLWFDKELTGKNWRIGHINKNGNATMNALRQLIIPEGAGGPNAGTYVVGSTAANYAGAVANAALTIGIAFIPSDTALTGQEARDAITMWNRCGAGPSNDPPNRLGAGGGAGQNGRPIVLEGIEPAQAFAWMRQRLPVLMEERRRVRFSSLNQDNLPVRDYYDKVCRAGQLLGFTNEVIEDQFFRGLSADNIIEIERIGSEKPAKDLVDILERVEKRKAEMHLGLTNRRAREEHLLKVEPIQKPSVTHQEPVEIKPVTSHAITQDMLNKLLLQHTENLTKNFQSQMQSLQEKINQPVLMQTTTNTPQAKDFQVSTESSWDRVMKRINKHLEQREKEKEDRKLIKAFKGLNISDDGFIKAYRNPTFDDYNDNVNDPMDTSNMVRIGDSLFDDDGNECTIQLVRKKKLIPNQR